MPTVSVILPTYNRATFLPQAFASIKEQQLQDWELVVVDDGSTDDTRKLVAELSSGLSQPVRYVHQENQGAYGARNTGLDLASGKYLAFFDSDDYWLPHHLADCVAAMEKHPDVDWVFGACRVVDLATQVVRVENTFYQGQNSKPHHFMALASQSDGGLRIIDSPSALRGVLRYGLACGLQNSVVRSSVFASRRFHVDFHNEAEDQLVAIRALAEGHRFAFYDNIHVIYGVHTANSSAAAANTSWEKTLYIIQAMVKGFENLRVELKLTRTERTALNRRISGDCFWQLGYAMYWKHDHPQQALSMFRKAFMLWPWDVKYWKTIVLAQLHVIGLKCPAGLLPKT